MIWKLLSGSAILVKRVNPSDKLRSGDIQIADGVIVVKNWFQEQRYSVSNVSGVRARIVVDYGLEENYEMEVLLSGDHKLLLDVGDRSHLSFLHTITGLSEEKIAGVLGDMYHRDLTEWTFL
jgi:hypothetical protein